MQLQDITKLNTECITEQRTLGGLWCLAAIMIIAASWFFYRYVAPKSWREWMRHPQYTGIFLMIIGQLIHWPTILTLLLSPLILLVYFNLARKEERDMIAKFGDKYRNYAKSVPMFFLKIREIKAFMKPKDSLYKA